MPSPNNFRDQEYVAFVDQDEVTDEVRDIALKYDPLNRSGREGFHLTEDNELHIDDSKVMAEHKLIEKKIPNDAIRIVPLPAETGQLVHQYGDNGFRLYDLPAPENGSIVGLVGPNGIGKSTALRILAGDLIPNFGTADGGDWEQAIDSFRGTTLQTHLEHLSDEDIETVHKHQRVDRGLSDETKTVRKLLADREGDPDSVIDELDLRGILDRPVRDLSGGERQRVAIARTLLADADLYLFDEPTSFLDVGRRVSIARTIREHVQTSNAAALVVEHDLATLDLLSDGVHVVYGEPGGFGVVSERLSTRAGINQFLDGYLEPDNVQIRRDSIEFPSASDHEIDRDDPVLEYPTLSKSFEEFDVSVEAGKLHTGEAVGIVGPNALGKTTFVKLLAGALEPDEGSVPDRVRVSYKPQYISPDGTGTVRQRLSADADLTAQSFRTRVADPLDLESLYDRSLDALSGGELQRVGVGLCLAREADLYLLDEPSAFLDVERRVSLADQLRRFGRQTDDPILVVDHDLFVIDRLADRLIVFEGSPGERGHASPPQSLRTGMNSSLADLGITFRRDARSGRPRVNKPGSQLDREQKREGEYYYG